jgi:alpha,alpha-trehalase
MTYLYQPVLDYIENYWAKITRHNPLDEKTLIGLPHPYIVPCHQGMFQEMYYWDSYFISLGLVASPHEQFIINMADNMAYLLERFGLIPNASRYYFLSRSQPPFFTAQVKLAYQVKQQRGDTDCAEYLAQKLALAIQEIETVWYGEQQPHNRRVHQGLSRYYDINVLDMLASCESGWDHSTRCDDDRWLAHLPVDLNALLYAYELDIAWMYHELGQPEHAIVWQKRADDRQKNIYTLMWDDEAGFFFDYDYVNQRRTPHPSLAGFYPLFAKLATPEQAQTIVEKWLPEFEQAGGLVTTLEAKAGRQWAYPNGWAPLQWLVITGLDQYGYHAEAQRLRRKWCDNCATVYEATGALWEKYNVVEIGSASEGGLYGQLAGFGWTNGVFINFARHLAAES